uniref:Uncharacterized protein n=1 Tax=Anguilla anguilla TaxID=7936 RepID=A0A0E9X0Y1_ANGAN
MQKHWRLSGFRQLDTTRNRPCTDFCKHIAVNQHFIIYKQRRVVEITLICFYCYIYYCNK